MNKEDELELLSRAVTPLLFWYRQNKRHLPWRDGKNPYYTWVSEIMLQQTRVETVIPYFKRFTDRLPDVKALADSSEDEVLKLWEGLGYYSRGRNLRNAAIQIVSQYGGVVPSDYETLLTLKGIGEYTAGAIASIAFGQRVPAVDGNVLRIVSRLILEEGDISLPYVKKKIRSLLMEILPGEAPGDFNQALMDLGAGICLPSSRPRCSECPLGFLCQAHMKGREELFPVRRPKKQRKIENKTILIVQDEERTVLRKREEGTLLAGMYGPPDLPGHVSARETAACLKELGFIPLEISRIEDSAHVFSHVEWRMAAYLVRIKKPVSLPAGGFAFVKRDEASSRYSVPSAYKAYYHYFREETK